MFDPFADFGGLGGGGFGRSSGGGANVGALRLDLYETQVRPCLREAPGEQPQRALAARGARIETRGWMHVSLCDSVVASLRR
jgi:hypothetical protein